jgi:hypothetical protein
LLLAAGLCAATVVGGPSPSTNAVPVVADVKKTGRSLFVVPTGPQEGKDPFFPRSVRPYGAPAPVKSGHTNSPTVELVLNGISGSTEKPLAIINNVTFGVNDDNDVTARGRRIRIRCVDINLTEGRVRVQIGSETRDLRLPINR